MCLDAQYENTKSGTKIGLLLVCGRPGPVSVHTPDICYPGAGYEMVQARPMVFSGGSACRRKLPEFITAEFVNDQSFPPDRSRVYWSWTVTGTWGGFPRTLDSRSLRVVFCISCTWSRVTWGILSHSSMSR